MIMGGVPSVAQLEINHELNRLRLRYRDFMFGLARGPAGGEPRFEAVRSQGDGSLYAVVTSDTGEMRRILDDALTS